FPGRHPPGPLAPEHVSRGDSARHPRRPRRAGMTDATASSPLRSAGAPAQRRRPTGAATAGGDENGSVPVLDDIDARPGSATSLLRTFIGLYLRPLGGEISSGAMVQLAGDLGIPVTRARTAITRLKQRGLLLAS